MTKKNKLIYFFISIFFFIVFDLYFSRLILNELRFKIPENKILDLLYVQNTGAAFNILENYKIFLVIFAIFAIATIITYAVKNAEKFSTIAGFWTAMLIAGISCNLYERIAYGHVNDFIKLNFVNFPIFNISDIFINLGVFAIIVIIIKNKYIKNL